MSNHEIEQQLGTRLLEAALRRITVPEMTRAFTYAEDHSDVWFTLLRELHGVITWMNQTAEVPDGMKNVKTVIEWFNEECLVLPSPLDLIATQNSSNRVFYGRMLRMAQEMFIDGKYTFHAKGLGEELVLAGAVIDGYSLFIGQLLRKIDSKSLDILTNATCEALVQLHLSSRDQPSMLLDAAKKLGWYDPNYGYDIDFLTRYGLME